MACKSEVRQEIELVLKNMLNSKYVEKRIIARGFCRLYESLNKRATHKELKQILQLIHDSWDLNLTEIKPEQDALHR